MTYTFNDLFLIVSKLGITDGVLHNCRASAEEQLTNPPPSYTGTREDYDVWSLAEWIDYRVERKRDMVGEQRRIKND